MQDTHTAFHEGPNHIAFTQRSREGVKKDGQLPPTAAAQIPVCGSGTGLLEKRIETTPIKPGAPTLVGQRSILAERCLRRKAYHCLIPLWGRLLGDRNATVLQVLLQFGDCYEPEMENRCCKQNGRPGFGSLVEVLQFAGSP